MNENILKIPYSAVNENWNLLQKFLIHKGNPRYIIVGDVDLSYRKDISDLGNLVGVMGYFNLSESSIESLGELEFVDGFFSIYECKNIETLGKLKHVGDALSLSFTFVKSLDGLEFVGRDLFIVGTKIHRSELNNIKVGGRIRDKLIKN